MSKFQIYAVQLDAAFKEARNRYIEAYNLMESKKRKWTESRAIPALQTPSA